MTSLRKLAPAAMLAAATVFAGLPALAQTATTEPATPAPAQNTPAPAQSTPAPADQATAPAATPAILPDHVLGSETAPVTVVEYASFTCPHCAAFNKDVWPKMKAEYVDTGKVKFIQREVYFDQFGLWAGVLANCAPAEKYYPISDMLFEEQKTWIGDGQPQSIADNLKKIGIKAGLTNEQMDACFADKAKVEQLIATFQKNAGDDKVNATPSFFIGGQAVSNGPWEDIKKVIDEKLAAAK
ncbi:DsbA family protein [Paracoccus pacificus]|uniref:DsbA family protein n=1 Tax=Paracoccus pacificus TaxID=1463598 RepID=A0ABW4R2U8_9RHOB